MILKPSFQAFAECYETGRRQVVWATLVSDLTTPVAALLKLGHGQPYSFLLESIGFAEGAPVRGRYSILGLKPDVIWRCRGARAEINERALIEPGAFTPCPEPTLAALRSLIARSRLELPAALPPMASGIFGYLGYDMVRLIERLPDTKPDRLGLPDAILLRPSVVIVFDIVRDVMALVASISPARDLSAREAYARTEAQLARIMHVLSETRGEVVPADFAASAQPEPQSNTTKAEYLAMVERAKEYIRAGDIYQVVPSQRFRLPFRQPPVALYRALRRTNPSPYMYFFDFDSFALVGSSPEILVGLSGDTVTIRPIAGTYPRGATPEEDRKLQAELLRDPKERAEHLMLLDLGRNDVGRVAKLGSVRVTEAFTLQLLSQVMHIVSNVEGTLDPRHDALSALLAGFPAGTVTGAPKIRAMEIIDELEKERRGPYAGAVGYFSANGSMDSCIVLRTAIIKDGMMYVQAGGGVVADSVAEHEYQETVNKAKAVFRAAEEAAHYAGQT